MNALLEASLLANQLLHLSLGVLAGEILQNLQPLSEVFILVLKLVNFLVLLVYEFRLLLDGFSETKVPLQHFLHHIDGLDDPPSNCIFRLIRCIIHARSLSWDGCPLRDRTVFSLLLQRLHLLLLQKLNVAEIGLDQVWVLASQCRQKIDGLIGFEEFVGKGSVFGFQFFY